MVWNFIRWKHKPLSASELLNSIVIGSYTFNDILENLLKLWEAPGYLLCFGLLVLECSISLNPFLLILSPAISYIVLQSLIDSCQFIQSNINNTMSAKPTSQFFITLICIWPSQLICIGRCYWPWYFFMAMTWTCWNMLWRELPEGKGKREQEIRGSLLQAFQHLNSWN